MGESTNPEEQSKQVMTEEHDIVAELLPAYVLDALDDEERLLVERHVRVCVQCQQEMASLEETVHMLAYAVPLYDPPMYLRERIRLLVTSPATPSPTSGQGQGEKGWTRWASSRPIAALLLLFSLLTAGLVTWNLQLRGQLADLQNENLDAHELAEMVMGYMESPDAYELHPIQAADDHLPARGLVLHDRSGRRFLLMAEGLPPLQGQQKYQVWVFDRRGHAIPVRDFRCDHKGRAVILFEVPVDVEDIVEIGVTVKPTATPDVPPPPILDGKFRYDEGLPGGLTKVTI